MSPRILALVVVMVCAAFGASGASAVTYVHGGTTTGNVLSNGTTIGGTLKAGTTAIFTSALGNVSCTAGTGGGTVGASGGTTVSGTLTSLSMSTCTDTIPFVDLQNCTKDPAVNPVLTVNSSGVVSIAAGNTLVCTLANGAGTCVYTSSTTSAQYNSTTAEMVFSNIPVSKVSGASFCPSTGSFSATIGPVKVTSGLYLNSNVVVNGTP